MKKIFGIVGWSGSGKTDLVCRLIETFKKKKILVGSIKHTHHNFEIDKEGKDSFKHISSGSEEVILYNEKKYAMISNHLKHKISFSEILKKFSKNIDLVLVEGLKNLEIKKIEVFRTNLNKELLCLNDKHIKGIVCDQPNEKIVKTGLPYFEFNQTQKISSFISDQISK
ncbi:MAG: molybdopterin-guanine dinucleotide biosynthesis protein B [Alphaproteobacteria bacterium]|nr:molybdopterin-guanine dinucleotide biosynthesis protein B [Alphaproteobacteria bacterium]|tara:strand:- start:40 stop:546 length:507 start_codon:yes stop_codon:yes gene_type:complete